MNLFLSFFRKTFLLCGGLLMMVHSGSLAEEWVFYTASGDPPERNRALIDWYQANSLKPVAEDKATIRHYYDEESVSANSPFGGGTVRVWGKSVVKGEVKSYDATMRDLERQEEKRLKRKLTALDAARIFPQAVSAAVKEITAQYEIACDEKDLYVREVNSFDSTGAKMTRQLNMDTAFWVPIQSGSVMEELMKRVCQ
jgi:hypothetical protein